MSESPVPAPQPPSGGTDARTVAIVAYLSLIGFVVALVLHNQNKSALGAYHLRQALGLVVCSAAMGVLGIIPFVGCLVLPQKVAVPNGDQALDPHGAWQDTASEKRVAALAAEVVRVTGALHPAAPPRA